MPNVHPENAPGPFYVDADCCITCGVPIDAAPDIFDWASDESCCVVKRQPSTTAELDRTMIAICSAEVDCIRYRGDDPAISERLAEAGQIENCDDPPARVPPLLRCRVRFSTGRADDDPRRIADRLRTWLAAQPHRSWRFRRPWPWSPGTAIFSWDGGRHFNSVRFEAAEEGFRAFLSNGYRGAGVGLGLLVHRWLTAENAQEIGWYGAQEDWRRPGFHMPV